MTTVNGNAVTIPAKYITGNVSVKIYGILVYTVSTTTTTTTVSATLKIHKANSEYTPYVYVSLAGTGQTTKEGGFQVKNGSTYTLTTYSFTWNNTASAASKTITYKLWTKKAGTGYTSTASATFNTAVLPSYAVTYANGGHGTAPGQQTKVYNQTLVLRPAMANVAGTAQSIAVTFNGNGGTSSSSSLSSSRSVTYVFSRWKATNGTTYTGGGNYTTNAATTMTAQWSTSYGSWSAISSFPSATRTNYTFNGWYTSATGGTRVDGSGGSYAPSAATTLYAQWTQVYASPQVSVNKIYRCDSFGDADDDSSHIAVVVGYQIWNTTSSANSVTALTFSVTSDNHPNYATHSKSLDSTELSTVNSGLVSSGNYLTGTCTVIVDAAAGADYSYSILTTLTDARGGGSYSSASAAKNSTLGSAFYTIDVLGDRYRYKSTADQSVVSGKTYYRASGGSYETVDVSAYDNLMRATGVTVDSTAYLAYQIPLEEFLVAEQEYTIQLWDVNVSHSGKSASDLGVCVYYCGGNVRIGGWYGAGNHFTNGHADHLTMTFTPHTSSGATASTGGEHTFSGGENNLSHSTVTSATSPFFCIYNSPSSASGTMSLTVGSWKLEKGGTGTSWAEALDDVDPSDEGWYEDGPRPGHGVTFCGIANKEGVNSRAPISILEPFLGNYASSSCFIVQDPSNFPTSQGAAPSANLYGDLLALVQDDMTRAHVRAVALTDGRQGLQLETSRANSSNTFTHHGVQMLIAADGTRSVVLNDAAAWRSALGFSIQTQDKAVTSSAVTLNGGSGTSITLNIAAPSGYGFMGILRVVSNHGYACHLGAFTYNGASSSVNITNRNSSAFTDLTVSMTVRFFKITLT